MAQEPQSFFTRVNGRNMHGMLAGDLASEPVPIVLVHGLGVSSRYFVPLARLLARHTLVVAPDLPGTGRSDRPARALGVRELSDALESWLRVLGLGRVVLVANSFGCQIVADLAVRHPERVDRLVFIGPTVDVHWRTIAKQIPRWLLEATRESLRLFPTLIWDYLRFGLRRFLATGRAALAHPFAALLPHAVAVEIPRAPHAAHYTRPDAVAAAIRAFLGPRRPDDPLLHEGAVQRVSR